MLSLTELTPVFLYFLIYSFLSYIIEIVWCSVRARRLINRGFLFGPVLPVYGISMVLVIFLTKSFKDNLVWLFLASTVICTAVEYFSSWLLERLVGMKWWDYSKTRKFQLNGRISLGTSLAFGLISSSTIYCIQPFLARAVSNLGELADYIAGICAIILILDMLASAYAIGVIKNNRELHYVSGDQTNEIKRLARLAILQFITGKNIVEQKFRQTQLRAERSLRRTKQGAQRKIRQTKRQLGKTRRALSKKITRKNK